MGSLTGLGRIHFTASDQTKLRYPVHNLKPKKRLGQHFLKDAMTADNIVALLGAESKDCVVEIGPGEGVLTERLLKKYGQFHVVEIDQDAVVVLRKRFKDTSLSIIHTDVLTWKPGENIIPGSFFIGNLPYNISSPFFFMLLENLAFIQEGVFMVQKEVAERICAKPGSKTYGILSVLLDVYFEREYHFTVPPEVFRPPPKVQSGVLRIVKKESEEMVPFPKLKRVVKAGFNQRRKTLRNALKSLDFRDFEEKDFLFTQRAEQLSTQQFQLLAQHLQT